MQSLCTTYRQSPVAAAGPPPLRLSSFSLKPFSPTKRLNPYRIHSRKIIRPLCSSHSPPNRPNQNPAPFSSVLTLAAAATAASFFAAGFHNPPPAAATVATVERSETATNESDSMTESEKAKVLEDHLDSHPDDVKALRALMEIKVKSGNLEEAIGIVDRIISVNPDHIDTRLLKSHLHSYNGNIEYAKQGFEELIDRDPLLVEAYHGLVMAANEAEDPSELEGILKRVEKAMEMCKKANKKQHLRDFKLLVAQVRVVQGKYEEALKVYQELNREEPRDFRPYLCQGIVYTLLRKQDEAEKQFEKYRRLVPRGHPYSQYFDDNMIATKVFSQMEENKRKGVLKN